MSTKSNSHEPAPTPAANGDTAAGAAPTGPHAGGAADAPEAAAELKAKVAQLEDALLRAKADFQNLQRRSTNERMEAVRFANTELIRSLLGVLDDLERCLAAAGSPDSHKTVVDGLKLVHANLVKALSGFGLETIPAVRERFDPTIHEALMQQPTAEAEPGVVIKEVAKGYRLKERVLRPARVVVSAAPAPCGQPATAVDEPGNEGA